MPGLGGATAVASGWFFCFAVADGDVWAWGDGRQGELGDGAKEVRMTPVATDLTQLCENRCTVAVAGGDALTVPAERQLWLANCSPDFELLEVEFPPGSAHARSTGGQLEPQTRIAARYVEDTLALGEPQGPARVVRLAATLLGAERPPPGLEGRALEEAPPPLAHVYSRRKR